LDKQKPTLILAPIHNSSVDILKCFKEGKPLSAEQTNILDWHEKELSSKLLDPLLKYYLHNNKNKHKKYHGTFLLPHEELNLEAIIKLKKRIDLVLKDNYSHLVLELSDKQVMQFKRLTHNEIIYWQGNEFVSGAKYYVGGIMPAIFFQWREYFCILKHSLIHDRNALQNINALYFEPIRDRTLEQCVKEYNCNLQKDLEMQNKLLLQNNLQQKEEPTENLIKPSIGNFYHIEPVKK